MGRGLLAAASVCLPAHHVAAPTAAPQPGVCCLAYLHLVSELGLLNLSTLQEHIKIELRKPRIFIFFHTSVEYGLVEYGYVSFIFIS